MTIEKGQPPEANPEKTDQPQTPPAPIAERLKGKTADELMKVLEEQEKTIGRLGQEKGDIKSLREELDSLKGKVEERPSQQQLGGYGAQGQPSPDEWLRYMQSQVVPPAQTTTQEEATPDFFADPYSASKRVVQSEVDKLRQEWKTQEATRYWQEAHDSFNEGQATALNSKNPLFKGIEGELSQAMWAAVRNGMVRPGNLRHAKTWEAAATLLRHNKGDLANVYATKPVVPVQTETPTPARPELDDDEDAIEIGDAERETMKFFRTPGGTQMTEKEAREIIQNERKAAKQGLNRRR